MTGKIHLTGRITIPADDQPRLVYLFEEHARLSRAEPGCLQFEIAREAWDAEVFSVAETFVDEAAFEAHQTRTKSSVWGGESRHLTRDFTRTVESG